MDWKNKLTKTPILVLFVILISVSVGTASALITITLAGNVQVDGDLNVDGTLSGPTIDALENRVVRDNTTFKGPFTTGTAVVLVDNAGIGGTSDVEVTWSLSDDECRVATLNGTISSGGDGGASGILTLLQDDGAFGGLANHADVSMSEAILLLSHFGTCNMLADEYVTVSTVGASE